MHARVSNEAPLRGTGCSLCHGNESEPNRRFFISRRRTFVDRGAEAVSAELETAVREPGVMSFRSLTHSGNGKHCDRSEMLLWATRDASSHHLCHVVLSRIPGRLLFFSRAYTHLEKPCPGGVFGFSSPAGPRQTNDFRSGSSCRFSRYSNLFWLPGPKPPRIRLYLGTYEGRHTSSVSQTCVRTVVMTAPNGFVGCCSARCSRRVFVVP